MRQLLVKTHPFVVLADGVFDARFTNIKCAAATVVYGRRRDVAKTVQTPSGDVLDYQACWKLLNPVEA